MHLTGESSDEPMADAFQKFGMRRCVAYDRRYGICGTPLSVSRGDSGIYCHTCSLDFVENAAFAIPSNATEPDFDTQVMLARDPSAIIRATVASYANTDPALLSLLARDPDPMVRCSVAQNECINSTEMLVTFAQDDSEMVRYAVFKRDNLPSEVFDEIVRNEKDSYVRRQALKHQDLTESAATYMIEHQANADDSREIAQNENVSSAILEKLLTHENVHVRNAVAANPNTSRSMLLELAGDPSWFVHEGIVKNPEAPAEALDATFEKLDDPSNTHIRDIALHENASDFALRQAAERAYGPVKTATIDAVLKHDNSSADTLTFAFALADASDDAKLNALNYHPNCDAVLVDLASRDKSTAVKIAAARDSRLPKKRLWQMARSRNQYILEAVLANPGTTSAVLLRIANSVSGFSGMQEISLIIMEHSELTPEIISVMAQNESSRVRLAAAEANGISDDDLAFLMVDQNEQVRVAATRRYANRHPDYSNPGDSK